MTLHDNRWKKTEKDFDAGYNRENRSKGVAYSKNEEYGELDDGTKLLIVGTITPPYTYVNNKEKKIEYYYTSEGNRLYGYIDEALKPSTSLKKLKSDLNRSEQSKAKSYIVEEIKKVLKENHVAFLDVVKKVRRKKGREASSYDNDIAMYMLDYEAFEDLKNVKKIICNSKWAYDGLLEIVKEKHHFDHFKNNKEYTFKPSGHTNIVSVRYLPQRGKGSSKKEWKNEIAGAVQ